VVTDVQSSINRRVRRKSYVSIEPDPFGLVSIEPDPFGLVCEKHNCLIHAYVLMTNHVHLLMTPNKSGAISKVMQSLGRRYVQYFNYSYQRTGTLMEGRYKSSLIDSEHYVEK
jgi:hypothetical protein